MCKVKKGFYTIGALRTNRILYPKGIRSKASEIAQTLKPSDTSLVTVGGREFYIWRYEGKLNGITNTASLTYYIPTMEHLLEFSWHHSSTDIPIGRFLQDSTI